MFIFGRHCFSTDLRWLPLAAQESIYLQIFDNYTHDSSRDFEHAVKDNESPTAEKAVEDDLGGEDLDDPAEIAFGIYASELSFNNDDSHAANFDFQRFCECREDDENMNTCNLGLPNSELEASTPSYKMTQFSPAIRRQLCQNPKFQTYNEEFWEEVNVPYFSNGIVVDSSIEGAGGPYGYSRYCFELPCEMYYKGRLEERGRVHPNRRQGKINWKDRSFDTFPRFQELPAELRLMIWKHALPDPRVVCFGCAKKILKLDQCSRYKIGQDLLLTCHEAAFVFKENYSIIPIRRAKELQIERDGFRYFDTKRDTLIVDFKDLKSLAKDDLWVDLSRVENLALADEFRNLDNDLSRWAVARALCPRMKSFSFLTGDVHDDDDTCEWIVPICLIKVDGNLHFTEVDEGRSGIVNELPNIQELVEPANNIYAKHEKIVSANPKDWKGVEFMVAVLGAKEEKTEFHLEVQWLVPRVPQSYNVIYYTQREGRPTHGKDEALVWCYDLCRLFKCRQDGTLDTVYDGIQELMEDEG